MHLDRGVRPCPGQLLAHGVTDGDCGGIAHIPVLDHPEDTRQIDPRRPGIAQSLVGQGRHEPFEGLIEPAVEGRARHRGHLKFQIRPQDIGLVGPARRPGGDDHGPYPHSEVQFALPLDAATFPAEPVDGLLRPDGLEPLAYVFSRHVCSPQNLQHALVRPVNLLGGGAHVDAWQSRVSGTAISHEIGLSGHLWMAL
jgi:hypothetical protein